MPSGALIGLYPGANAGLGAALGSAKGMRAAEGKSMLNGVAAARGSTLAEGIVGSDPRLSPANPRVLLLLPNPGVTRVAAWKIVLPAATEGAEGAGWNSALAVASFSCRLRCLASCFSCALRAFESCCLTSLSTRSTSRMSASSCFCRALSSFLLSFCTGDVGVAGGEGNGVAPGVAPEWAEKSRPSG